MRNITLESERLILRPLYVSDAEAVFEWASDERVTKFMIYPTHTDISVTREWLSSMDSLDEKRFEFGFVLKETGKLIGSGCIGWCEPEKAWSFGYNLRYDEWGKGLCTEAAMRMIEFVRSEYGAEDFVGEFAADNPASGRVMEKCGLRFSRDTEYSKSDGSVTFKAKIYRMHKDIYNESR